MLRFRLLVKQGQERVLKRLHLALSLGTIAGRVWGEQGTQAGHLRREPVILVTEAGDLGREPVILASKVGVFGRNPLVLSRESGHLLLRNPRLSLGFVPLLLAKLHSVLPEARGSGFGSVVHGSGFISIGALRPKHYEATTTTQPCGL